MPNLKARPPKGKEFKRTLRSSLHPQKPPPRAPKERSETPEMMEVRLRQAVDFHDPMFTNNGNQK